MHPDGMGWSWADLEGTPPYVRRYCLDFLNIKARVAAAERDRVKRAQGG
jgi:hypothetical protein